MKKSVKRDIKWWVYCQSVQTHDFDKQIKKDRVSLQIGTIHCRYKVQNMNLINAETWNKVEMQFLRCFTVHVFAFSSISIYTIFRMRSPVLKQTNEWKCFRDMRWLILENTNAKFTVKRPPVWNPLDLFKC